MKYLTCAKCGKVDKPNKTIIPYNVGTSVKMQCSDCATNGWYAKLCRNCCPTKHGTK